MKKLLNILLVMIMLVTIGTVSAQTDTTPSITITRTDTKSDVTYSIYKLFDLSYNDTTKSYTYTINEDWNTFFTTGAGKDLIETKTVGNTVYVTGIVGDDNTVITTGELTDNANITNFRDAVLNYAKNNQSVLVASKTAQKDSNTTSVVFDEDLTLGYYLVDSSLGALVSLTTTSYKANVVEKNTQSVPTKTATETTVSVNQEVHYKVEFTIGKGATNYVFTDKMSTGLTFKANSTVTVSNNKTALTSGYTYNAPSADVKGNSNDVTFTITFDDAYVKAHANETITIEYTAVVNEDAVTTDKVTNKATLTYGDGTTVDSEEVEVKLYDLTFKKIDSTSETELSGAKFSLWTSKNGSNDQVALVHVTTDTEDYYRPATTEEMTANDFVSAQMVAGTVAIKGLASGTYYLQEDEAPVGYSKLAERFEVTTNNLNTIDYTAVPNTTGNVLPSTGGMGTTLFVTVGSLMVLAFGVMLVTKARVAKELN